jgi:hypothetical protein
VPDLPLPHVQPARIVVVRAAKGFGKCIGVLGNGDEVHVIRHQTKSHQPHPIAAAIFSQRMEIDAPVVVVKEPPSGSSRPARFSASC